MSHVRDLQRLRNTRNQFQIKRGSHGINDHKIIHHLKIGNPQHERLLIPQLFKRDMEQTHKFQDFGNDPYKKYLESKQILTNRDSRDSVPKTSQKIKHKRGASFGIDSTYYNNRTKEIPQSGLSIYNFTNKICSVQGDSIPISSQNSKRSNPLTSRREKVPELFVINDSETQKRQSKELKLKKQSRVLKQLKQEAPISKQSFEIMYPVGKGGFGKVWKIRQKKNQQIYAMKEMQKSKIINKKSVNSVMNQRTLLSQLSHPFIVNMIHAFQDRENLYLIMDYLNGGDLRYHIGCKGKFNQAESKFFVANILISLEYIHSKRIIHRDLKPENFVFDSEGYLRITDFGVSRTVRDDNHQDTSGTPGYMSPEVICHKNHTYMTDYFALGVMAYEFMLGRRPYNGRNRKEIREAILTKQAEVKLDQLPYRWSPKAADFINSLLIRNPDKRLGHNGIDDIKNHPWLSDIDWKGIRNKTFRSPFIPVSIQQNYDDYKEQISEDTIDENAAETKMMLRESSVQELFEGYEYNNSKNLAHSKKRTTHSTNYTEEKISGRGK